MFWQVTASWSWRSSLIDSFGGLGNVVALNLDETGVPMFSLSVVLHSGRSERPAGRSKQAAAPQRRMTMQRQLVQLRPAGQTEAC